jgi:transcriptional regulator with XRE-family HTH domain
MIIGKRIKELRISKKISQRGLAEIIGVSQAIFVKWENEEHEPKANYIVELAKYFDVTTDYLLGLENEDYTKNRENSFSESRESSATKNRENSLSESRENSATKSRENPLSESRENSATKSRENSLSESLESSATKNRENPRQTSPKISEIERLYTLLPQKYRDELVGYAKALSDFAKKEIKTDER